MSDDNSAPYDSTAETLRHIHPVRDHLNTVIAALMERGREHDASKFSEVEKPVLDKAWPGLPQHNTHLLANTVARWPGEAK